jgi:hypothetical protein
MLKFPALLLQLVFLKQHAFVCALDRLEPIDSRVELGTHFGQVVRFIFFESGQSMQQNV